MVKRGRCWVVGRFVSFLELCWRNGDNGWVLVLKGEIDDDLG